jgi:hypothetical protein
MHKKHFNLLPFFLIISTILVINNSCSQSTNSNKHLYVIEVNGKYGCIDSLGNIIIKPTYDNIDGYSIGEGLIGFQKNGKWGYMDYSGKVIIEPIFRFCAPFNEGVAAVKDANDKWGFINKQGRWIIDPVYYWASTFHNGLAIVKIQFVENSGDGFYHMSNELAGLINIKGEIVVPIEYIYMTVTTGFTEDLIILGTQDYGSAVFSKEGKLLFTRPFHIGKYCNGIAPCPNPWDSPPFFIDKEGNIILQLSSQFKSIDHFSDGLARCYIDKMNGFIDRSGVIVIPPKYVYASNFENGLALVQIGEKYGFIDKTGVFKIPPVYDEAYVFDHGLSWVELGSKAGYINTSGKWVWSNAK